MYIFSFDLNGKASDTVNHDALRDFIATTYGGTPEAQLRQIVKSTKTKFYQLRRQELESAKYRHEKARRQRKKVRRLHVLEVLFGG